MALWKMRLSGLEQKGEVNDKEPEPKQLASDEGSLLGNEDVKMTEVYTAVLSVDVSLALLSINSCLEPCIITCGNICLNFLNYVFTGECLDGDVLWRSIGAEGDAESWLC